MESVIVPARLMWSVAILEGYPSDLERALESVRAAGGEVKFVLPNGVNRWTIIAELPRVGV